MMPELLNTEALADASEAECKLAISLILRRMEQIDGAEDWVLCMRQSEPSLQTFILVDSMTATTPEAEDAKLD